MRTCLLFALLLLGACAEPRQPGPAAADLAGYRFATVVFVGNGPESLQEAAAYHIGHLGFQLVAADDQHLQDARVAAATLWFRFEILHEQNAQVVQLVVRDRSGADRFSVKARHPELVRAVDDAVAAFAPSHPAPDAATPQPREF